MDDTQFQNFMKQMETADDLASPVSAKAIWWRAQIRRREVAEERATRPILIAERAGATLGWIMAAVLAAGLSASALAAFLVLTLVFAGGLSAIALKKA